MAKELKSIVIAGLPEEEAGYLKENLREEKGLKLIFADTKEKLEEDIRAASDTGLLISGFREALRKAAELDMAAICYEKEAGVKNQGLQPYPPADMAAEGFREIDAHFLKRVYKRHHHIPWEILETPRCTVRELGLNDLDALFELYSCPGMTDYMEGLYPYEKERLYQKAYIENMYGFYGYGMWLVFEKSSGRLIGRAGVEHREETCGLELGYAIASPFQQQGFAYEVCSAILDYVKYELGFKEISCLISQENHISVHLAEKLGFAYQTYIMIEGNRMLKYYLHF